MAQPPSSSPRATVLDLRAEAGNLSDDDQLDGPPDASASGAASGAGGATAARRRTYIAPPPGREVGRLTCAGGAAAPGEDSGA